MNLYLNNKKYKLYLNGVLCRINLLISEIISSGIRLLSSDGITLRDKNGFYLTSKDGEE